MRAWKLWSDSELEDLRRDYPHIHTEILARRMGRSMRSLNGKASTLGIKKSSDYLSFLAREKIESKENLVLGQPFERGHIPHNLGKKGFDAGGRSRSTQFRVGHDSHTWRPIGSIAYRDPYLFRKITDTGVTKKDWMTVQMIVWTQHHGTPPPGHCLFFVDSDKTNCSIDNLVCIRRDVVLYLNQTGFHDLSVELRPAAVALARLECKRREIVRSC